METVSHQIMQIYVEDIYFASAFILLSEFLVFYILYSILSSKRKRNTKFLLNIANVDRTICSLSLTFSCGLFLMMWARANCESALKKYWFLYDFRWFSEYFYFAFYLCIIFKLSSLKYLIKWIFKRLK